MQRRRMLLQVKFIMGKEKDTRTRNWSFIQYDDSSPSNWREVLDELKIPWCESPLHDSDMNADGTKKKNHRHIVFANAGKKSFEQMQEISNLVSGVIPQPVVNMKGMIRYLVHLDNPEKHQYNVDGIICHCGFDKEIYLKKSTSDIRETLKEIFKFIRSNDVQSYSDLVDYLTENDLDDWFEVVTMKHTISVKEYIKSYAYKHLEIDAETGERRYVGDYLMRWHNK